MGRQRKTEQIPGGPVQALWIWIWRLLDRRPRPIQGLVVLLIVAMTLVVTLEAPRGLIGDWVAAWMVRTFRPQAQRTMIDLDAKQVLRIGSRFQASEPLDETNASAPVSVDTQPVVIKWNAPENRRIAVYMNQDRLLEGEFSSGHEFSGLAPGAYYLKITRPSDQYTPVHLNVLSRTGTAR